MSEVRAQARGIVTLVLIAFCLMATAEAQEPFRYDGAITFGGVSNEWLHGVQADANGSVYVCGAFREEITFAPGNTIVSDGGYDGFVAKFSRARSLVWARVFRGPGSELCLDLRLDLDGNIIVVGQHGREVYFDSSVDRPVFARAESAFLAKLSSSGDILWVRAPVHEGYNSEVIVDGANNIYVAGARREEYDPPLWSLHAAKYDKSGRQLWKVSVRTSPTGYASFAPYGLSTDSSNGVLVTGYFWHENRNRAYTTRLSADTGDPVWEKITQGTGSATAYAIATGHSPEALYITGQFKGTVDFDPTAGVDLRTAPGNLAIFVSKYQFKNGAYDWTYSVGSPEARPGASDSGDAIFVAPHGDIYVAGSFSGPLDFDPFNPGGELTNGSLFQTMFLLVLDPDANYRWVGAMTAPGTGGVITGGATLSGHDLFVCGEFGGVDIDLDPTSGVDLHSSTPGPGDAFVIKLVSH